MTEDYNPVDRNPTIFDVTDDWAITLLDLISWIILAGLFFWAGYNYKDTTVIYKVDEVTRFNCEK